MIKTDELYIVNYCHPDCEPFMNICRLPKEEAFSKARKMAAAHPDTTAFFRFADFDNYYPLRMKQDKELYSLFVSLGGKPKEKHPLSFVLQGSEYLDHWFGNGTVSRLDLKDIPAEFISFTLGDSGAVFEKSGKLTVHTKETLLKMIREYQGSINDFMDEVKEKYDYIEAQLWNDDFLKY